MYKGHDLEHVAQNCLADFARQVLKMSFRVFIGEVVNVPDFGCEPPALADAGEELN